MKELPAGAAMWTAVSLITLGLILVFMAWDGAAGIPVAQAQIPYLISGGLGGTCLVATGLVLVRTIAARKDTAQLVAELQAVRAAVQALQQEADDPVAAVPPAPEPRVPPAPRVPARR